MDDPPHPTPPHDSHRPGVLLLFGGPLLVCMGVVLVGAAHAWLGLPLGVEFASEVWGFAKTAIAGTMVYLPFAAYVKRHNAAVAPPVQFPPPPVQRVRQQTGPGRATLAPGASTPRGRLTTGRHRLVIDLVDDEGDPEDET